MSEKLQSRVYGDPTLPPVATDGNTQRILVLLLINISLAILWHTFLPVWGVADYAIGIVLGALVLTLYEREYGQRLWWLLSFTGYVFWALLVSNAKMALLVLQRTPQLDPGIIAVPLAARSTLEILILAGVIALTPGTMVVELSYNDNGEPIFFIHSLTVESPEALRREIKDTFEHRMLLFTRGSA